MKNIILYILFSLASSTIFAKPIGNYFLKDAAYVAEVKSFSYDGFLNCEFQCYLDMNYVDVKNQPRVHFQVGTKENPVEYGLIILDEEFFKNNPIEKIFNDNGYKLKLNLGLIAVKPGYIARIVIFENGKERIINLKSTNYKDSLTIMNIDKEAETRGLCKAEAFLRKIHFDRLYDEYSYIEE